MVKGNFQINIHPSAGGWKAAMQCLDLFRLGRKNSKLYNRLAGTITRLDNKTYDAASKQYPKIKKLTSKIDNNISGIEKTLRDMTDEGHVALGVQFSDQLSCFAANKLGISNPSPNEIANVIYDRFFGIAHYMCASHDDLDSFVDAWNYGILVADRDARTAAIGYVNKNFDDFALAYVNNFLSRGGTIDESFDQTILVIDFKNGVFRPRHIKDRATKERMYQSIRRQKLERHYEENPDARPVEDIVEEQPEQNPQRPQQQPDPRPIKPEEEVYIIPNSPVIVRDGDFIDVVDPKYGI